MWTMKLAACFLLALSSFGQTGSAPEKPKPSELRVEHRAQLWRLRAKLIEYQATRRELAREIERIEKEHKLVATELLALFEKLKTEYKAEDWVLGAELEWVKVPTPNGGKSLQ